MGLFIQQNDNRSKLQERLAADLREKAARQSAGSDPIDQTKDSNYVKDTEQTSGKAWAWIALGFIAIISGVLFFAIR